MFSEISCIALHCTLTPSICDVQDDGYVAKILVSSGTKDIRVGTVVAVIVEDKDDVRPSSHFGVPCCAAVVVCPHHRCNTYRSRSISCLPCPTTQAADCHDNVAAAAQAGAFAQYQPGEGGGEAAASNGGGGGGETPTPSGGDEAPAPSDGDKDKPATPSGGGGGFPSHILLNMPALSPTMEQGEK